MVILLLACGLKVEWIVDRLVGSLQNLSYDRERFLHGLACDPWWAPMPQLVAGTELIDTPGDSHEGAKSRRKRKKV